MAGLLFATAARCRADDLVMNARDAAAYQIIRCDDAAGQADLLCDGLMFDCRGLTPAPALHIDAAMQQIALPAGFALADHALVTVGPGAQLAGAGQLLPVVRALAGLVRALAAMPGVCAVVWLPARTAMSPQWFAEATGHWLNGGAFPALAMTGLARSDQGFASTGLAYFTGQEFVFGSREGVRETDARGAVRLTDWLVAHGRIDAACDIELPGFGTVRLEPQGPDSLRATPL
ncbi:hypothetical protein [Novosphingobium sp.]|uniref:hypothetical protein n=1 Tax=Novosphingobium sp. TaxID=1874826 RepID=UPI0033406812